MERYRQSLPAAPSAVQAVAEPWEGQSVSGLRANPERLAWVVLLASFTVFLFLAVSLPLAVHYVVRMATVRESARLEPTIGTILLYQPRTAEPIAVTSARKEIGEGSRIVTEEDATQGVLGLLHSDKNEIQLGSVQLYPQTTLELVRIRRPRFASSDQPYQVRLNLSRGRARIFTNSPDDRPLLVEVETPHGQVMLTEGSYRFSVTPDRTEVTVQLGTAQLRNHGDETVTLQANQRSWITADAAPAPPMSPERNLITNGDFSQPLLDSWKSYTVAENVIQGEVQRIPLEGRWIARFRREGEDNVHTEVGIRQQIDQDTNVYDSLVVRLDVRLRWQSLEGAGHQSSEFPIRLEIGYTDIYGKDLNWGHGFYYRDSRPGWWIQGGEKIRPFVWYSYESPNLMELLAETRPARLNFIRVYASGWNYDAMVSEISLVAH